MIYENTVGLPLYVLNFLMISEKQILNVFFHDTSGKENYRAINETYYKRADSCILVYDITNEISFRNCIDYYIPLIKEKSKRDVQVLLIGNKSDIESKRVIQKEEGNELAQLNNFLFFETSCLNYESILEAFNEILELKGREYFMLNNKKKKIFCCN